MAIVTEPRSIMRTSLRLFAVLAFFGLMLLINQPTASAQVCAPGCPTVIIRNCTWPPIQYHIQFILCCDGMQVISPVVGAPIAPPPCSVVEWVVPEPCTIIPSPFSVWNITPPPPSGWSYNPATCTLNIY